MVTTSFSDFFYNFKTGLGDLYNTNIPNTEDTDTSVSPTLSDNLIIALNTVQPTVPYFNTLPEKEKFKDKYQKLLKKVSDSIADGLFTNEECELINSELHTIESSIKILEAIDTGQIINEDIVNGFNNKLNEAFDIFDIGVIDSDERKSINKFIDLLSNIHNTEYFPNIIKTEALDLLNFTYKIIADNEITKQEYNQYILKLKSLIGLVDSYLESINKIQEISTNIQAKIDGLEADIHVLSDGYIDPYQLKSLFDDFNGLVDNLAEGEAWSKVFNNFTDNTKNTIVKDLVEFYLYLVDAIYTQDEISSNNCTDPRFSSVTTTISLNDFITNFKNWIGKVENEKQYGIDDNYKIEIKFDISDQKWKWDTSKLGYNSKSGYFYFCSSMIPEYTEEELGTFQKELKEELKELKEKSGPLTEKESNRLNKLEKLCKSKPEELSEELFRQDISSSNKTSSFREKYPIPEEDEYPTISSDKIIIKLEFNRFELVNIQTKFASLKSAIHSTFNAYAESRAQLLIDKIENIDIETGYITYDKYIELLDLCGSIGGLLIDKGLFNVTDISNKKIELDFNLDGIKDDVNESMEPDKDKIYIKKEDGNNKLILPTCGTSFWSSKKNNTKKFITFNINRGKTGNAIYDFSDLTIIDGDVMEKTNVSPSTSTTSSY